jgi:hypothetical protein
MTYTCIKCIADTDNDCDWCDECIAESMKDDAVENTDAPPVAILGDQGETK